MAFVYVERSQLRQRRGAGNRTQARLLLLPSETSMLRLIRLMQRFLDVQRSTLCLHRFYCFHNCFVIHLFNRNPKAFLSLLQRAPFLPLGRGFGPKALLGLGFRFRYLELPQVQASLYSRLTLSMSLSTPAANSKRTTSTLPSTTAASNSCSASKRIHKTL